MGKIIKTPNTSVLTRKYINQWVALSPNYKKVIASGKSLSEVLEKTAAEKRKVVFRVSPNLGYVPFSVR